MASEIEVSEIGEALEYAQKLVQILYMHFHPSVNFCFVSFFHVDFSARYLDACTVLVMFI